MKFIKLTLLDYKEVDNIRFVKKVFYESGYIYVNVENIDLIEQKWFEYYSPEISHIDGDYGSFLHMSKGKSFYIKETPEEIIEMINGKPEITNEEQITEEELREIMKDPRYWRDQEPEYVKKVENGFKKLYGNN